MIKKCFTIAIVLMFVGEVLAGGFQLGFGGAMVLVQVDRMLVQVTK